MSVDARAAIKQAFDSYADERTYERRTEQAPLEHLVVDPPTTGRLSRPNWSPSRGMQVAVVCVLLAVVTTAALVLMRSSKTETSLSAPATLTVAQITFDYPTTLNEFDSKEESRGPSSVIAYLTDQAVTSSCETTTTTLAETTTCGSLIDTLMPGKTFIQFTDFSNGTQELTLPNAVIAGFPAEIQRGPVNQTCPVGTSTQSSAAIAYQPGRTLRVDGCFSADATTQLAFDTMLRTAR